MTDTKFGLRFLIGVALIGGTALLASCGGSDKMTRTTTTEQATVLPIAPTVSTTTTSTQQSRP